jgi:hypothetical protein
MGVTVSPCNPGPFRRAAFRRVRSCRVGCRADQGAPNRVGSAGKHDISAAHAPQASAKAHQSRGLKREQPRGTGSLISIERTMSKAGTHGSPADRPIGDGSVIKPRTADQRGYTMECCSCGLRHRLDFSLNVNGNEVDPRKVRLELRVYRIDQPKDWLHAPAIKPPSTVAPTAFASQVTSRHVGP